MSRAAPTVSVVVPTYYRNDRLAEAIESVLATSHDRLEVLVVDDSGEAHARPVVESYDDVDYLPLESNRGAQTARSIGVARTTGEYVQFLDDDDRLLDGKFTRQIELLRSRDDVGVVYGGYESESGGRVSPRPEARGDVLEHALRWELVPCCNVTMLLERPVLERLHPLPHDHAADDTGLLIELARETAFDYVDEPVAVLGDTEDSLGFSWENLEARRWLLDRYEELYEQFPPEVRNAAVSQYHWLLGRKLLEEQRWSARAIAAFARSVWYAPDPTLREVGPLLYSVGGRPAKRLAERCWSSLSRDRDDPPGDGTE